MAHQATSRYSRNGGRSGKLSVISARCGVPSSTPDGPNPAPSAANADVPKPTAPLPRRQRRVVCVDVAALTLLGLLIAVPLRGHFVKPHSDFFELCEVGVALVHGEVPPTFKRAPVYPLLVGGGGAALRALGVHDPPPERLAAEWLNVLLLPINGVLVYLLGRRWLVAGARGGDAPRWWAAWFFFLPWGVYCTTHLVLEPLLITTLLGTVLLAGSRHRWPAYAAAAVATMTRYDGAGLILGLALVDGWRDKRLRRAVLAALFALVPLAIWLGFTALTWTERSEEHYLRQIAYDPRFDPVGAARTVLDVCFSPERLIMPVWVAIDPTALRMGLRLLLTAAALAGATWLLVRRDGPAIVAAAGALGYVLVHAVFPYQFPRFGYPLAPLLLLAAGAGLAAGWHWLGTHPTLRPLRALVVAAIVVFGAPLLFGELASLSATPFDPPAWVPAMLVRAMVVVVILWAAPAAIRPARFGRVCLVLGLLLLARVQLRETVPLLGTGREMAGLVDAARWIARHTGPDDAVLCDQRGLFALYASDRPPARFVSYDQIRAADWRAILAECRQRGVRYFVWHSRIFEGHADPRAAARWRLQRFAALDDPQRVPGLSLVWSEGGSLNVWVLRVDAE